MVSVLGRALPPYQPLAVLNVDVWQLRRQRYLSAVEYKLTFSRVNVQLLLKPESEPHSE